MTLVDEVPDNEGLKKQYETEFEQLGNLIHTFLTRVSELSTSNVLIAADAYRQFDLGFHLLRYNIDRITRPTRGLKNDRD